MATFDKAFVMGYGSLDDFARADGCYLIYEDEVSYYVVRRYNDANAILGLLYKKGGGSLVWERGRAISSPISFTSDELIAEFQRVEKFLPR